MKGSNVIKILLDSATNIWYAWKCDSNGQGYVLQGALQPGENATADYRKIKIDAIEDYGPTATTGTAVTAAATTVLDWVDVGSYTNWAVYIKNAGGGSGHALANVIVQASPDQTETVDLAATKDVLEIAAETLASGSTGVAYRASKAALKYIRIRANCGGGNDTTVDCWLKANNG